MSVKRAAFIKPEKWIHHFKKLHSDIEELNLEQKVLCQKLNVSETEMKPYFKCLDQPFSEKESDILKRLKNNKSAADDRMRNEMIKYCTIPLLKTLVKLYNFLLETGIYPDSWCRGIIIL